METTRVGIIVFRLNLRRSRLMTAAKPLELISVEDYLAGELTSDVKYEYRGGYVYAVAGASTIHNRVATTLIGLLFSQLRGKVCEVFNSDMKLRVQFPTHTRFYYPDAMVVCDPNASNQAYQDTPVIVAEVISNTTRRIDEYEKHEAYLTIPSLSAYILIETTKPRIVIHRRTSSGFVTEVYDGLTSIAPLPAIQAELVLAELYERVNFEQDLTTDDE